MLMPLRRPGLLHRMPTALCRFVAAVLILGAAAYHVNYLLRGNPLDLASDEAHYWDWSRHLDWSYYSKGPLVAWLIRGSCELFGGWSEQMTGNPAFAIRLPAILCGTLLLVSLYVLAVQVLGREQMGLAVVGIALTLPVIAVGGLVMTIDAPYTCCWGWALVLTYRAIFRGSGWAWPAAGVVIGLGVLAKYTMGLFLPSVFLFLLFTPEYRGLLRRPGFWVMSGIALLSCLPILIWNAQNHWITIEHLLALAGFGQPAVSVSPSEGPHFYWLGPINYVLGQTVLLLGIWFVTWVLAMVTYRPTVEKDAGMNYLWWLSAPMFFWFWAFSVKTDGGEVNWPVTAYLSGLVLGAAWIGRQLDSPRAWYRRCTRFNIGLGCAVGLAVTLVVHHSEILHPLLARFVGPPTQANHFPLRKVDPTCRLRGWRPSLAPAVDAGVCSPRGRRQGRARAGRPELDAAGRTGRLLQGTPTRVHAGSLDRRPAQPVRPVAGAAQSPGRVSRPDVRLRRRPVPGTGGGLRSRRTDTRGRALRGGATDLELGNNGLPRLQGLPAEDVEEVGSGF